MQTLEISNIDKYQDLIKNEALQRIADWKEPNSSTPTVEDNIKENAKKIIDVIFGNLEESVPKKQ
jgi:hypothetical protein